MFPYQNLEVYQKAFSLNKIVYNMVKQKSVIPVYAKQQLGRSCMSIMLNIAEGCAKLSSRDRKNFMVIARASAFECASLIEFLYSENELSLEQKVSLIEECESISRMLYNMIKKLGNDTSKKDHW